MFVCRNHKSRLEEMDKDAIDKRISELLLVLNTGHTKSDLEEHVLDAIPELFSLLRDETFSQQPEMVAACMELIELLPEVCPPKEVIIALLDQAYGFKDDIRFRALLRPIGKSIQRLGNNKYHSLDLAVENLYDHLATLSLPQDKPDLIETLVLGSSPTAEKISLMVAGFLEFVEPFVKELSWLNDGSADVRSPVQKHVQNLTVCLIKVLDRPLGYLNLSVTEAKSISCLCGERCVQLISRLQPNFIKTFKDILEKNETIARTVKRRKAEKEQSPQSCLSADVDVSDQESDITELLVPEIGLAVLAYLIFDQHLYFQSLPQVYTVQHMFEINKRFVITLLKAPHSQLVYKGMRLHLCLLNNIPLQSLDSHILQCDETQELLRSIINTTISCKVKELNQLAVVLFKKFLSSFEGNGRLFLLNFISKSYTQSNVQAYITKLVKDEICECLGGEQLDKSYAAILLKKFLNRFFSYKPSAKGSLLEEGDRIIASLNLLRYLVIRDKPCRNTTGIWTHVPVIEENFLKTLRAELQVMQSFVQDKMRIMREGGQPNSNIDDDFKYDVTVGNKILENLTPEQQMETLHSAFINLDMMESVLIRVEQLIGEEKQELTA